MEPFPGIMFAFGGNFAINGFALRRCRLLPISQNTASFSMGTTYGNNGMNTFALPDSRGHVPIGVGGAGHIKLLL